MIRNGCIAVALATLSLAEIALGQDSPPPPIGFVASLNGGCKVGRPNVRPGETVRWQGQCLDGFAQGVGTAQWASNGKPTLRYEGSFSKGLIEGKGRMIGEDGDRYDGEYLRGLRHGTGTYTYADGSKFQGQYRNNQRIGGAAPASAGPVAPVPTSQPASPQQPKPVAQAPETIQSISDLERSAYQKFVAKHNAKHLEEGMARNLFAHEGAKVAFYAMLDEMTSPTDGVFRPLGDYFGFVKVVGIPRGALKDANHAVLIGVVKGVAKDVEPRYRPFSEAMLLQYVAHQPCTGFTSPLRCFTGR